MQPPPPHLTADSSKLQKTPTFLGSSSGLQVLREQNFGSGQRQKMESNAARRRRRGPSTLRDGKGGSVTSK